jgi:hypothetical protein
MPLETSSLETRVRDAAGRLHDQLLDALRVAQDGIGDAVEQVGDVVRPLVPELPSSLPAPSELVEAAFGTAERLLASQRAFTGRIVAAFEREPATA